MLFLCSSDGNVDDCWLTDSVLGKWATKLRHKNEMKIHFFNNFTIICMAPIFITEHTEPFNCFGHISPILGANFNLLPYINKSSVSFFDFEKQHKGGNFRETLIEIHPEKLTLEIRSKLEAKCLASCPILIFSLFQISPFLQW